MAGGEGGVAGPGAYMPSRRTHCTMIVYYSLLDNYLLEAIP